MIKSRKYRPVIFFVSIFAVLIILNLFQGGPVNWIQNFFIAILVALFYRVSDSFSKNDKEKKRSTWDEIIFLSSYKSDIWM